MIHWLLHAAPCFTAHCWCDYPRLPFRYSTLPIEPCPNFTYTLGKTAGSSSTLQSGCQAQTSDRLQLADCTSAVWHVELPRVEGMIKLKIMSKPSGDPADKLEFYVGTTLQATQRNAGCTAHCEHVIEIGADDVQLTVKAFSATNVTSEHMITEQWEFACGEL